MRTAVIMCLIGLLVGAFMYVVRAPTVEKAVNERIRHTRVNMAYFKDDDAGLCFVNSWTVNSQWSVSNVPCTDKVMALINTGGQ